MHSTHLDLDAIQARTDAATPGPWGLYDDGTGLIDIAADLQDTGHGYRCRRYVGQLESEQIDNDPTHRDWTEEQDWAQSTADAAFIATARTDVPALLAEVRRLRAQVVDLGDENAKLIRWHGEDGAYEQRLREQHDRDVAELNRLRARVAELERPAIEAKRGEIQLSMRQLAAQAREDGDYESEAIVLQRLADREEQWKTEDAAAEQPAPAVQSRP